MVRMFERILCAVLGHKYQIARVFSPTSRQLTCTRCGHLWGMNDTVRALVPWDGELKEMYKQFGQWPQGLGEKE